MKKLIVVSVLMLVLIPVSMFSAASNLSGKPGPASTVTLKSKSGYKQFNSVNDVKDFVNPYAGWKVSYKAMWTNPTAYMVNSAGEKRSNTVTLYGTKYYSGGNNSGQVGYKYYTKLKPSSSQAGNDAITLSLQADG